MSKYNCDVVFIVEHKNRELETYKQISEILAQNGLKCLIIQRFFSLYLIPLLSPKVIVSNLFKDFIIGNKVCVDLFRNKSAFILHHWEQLLAPYTEEMNFKKDTDFERNECITLHWNKDFENILRSKDYNMDKSHFVNNPNLSLLNDFSKKESILNNKLRREFNLDSSKKLLFFPASFFWANFNLKGDPLKVKLNKFFTEQFYYTKDFISEVLKHEDTYIIFRPHPYETEKQYFDVFGEKIFNHDNFIFTHEYTVKEWTVISNYTISNFSTTVYDAYLLGKKACFFNVGGFLEEITSYWLVEPKHISSYKEFVEFKKSEAPIRNEFSEIDFNEKVAEIIKTNLQNEKYKVNISKRVSYLLKKDIYKTFFRSLLCKYFNCYKVDDSIKPDYFEPVIIKPKQ